MQRHEYSSRKSEQNAKEKSDVSIMNTNNSCIVSKRSVEKIYHKDDHGFLRHFVKKFQRRSPLINRGYWLRMRVVERAIRNFLADVSQKQKFVVNLGCGYDTVAFKFLAKERGLCGNVRFVDVDYAQLLRHKCELIRETQAFLDVLKDPNHAPEDPSILLDSKEYSAVACDLQDVKALAVLRQMLDGDDKRVLFIAEVSTTYMNPTAVDKLIQWAAKFSHAQYLLLEQYLPNGPEDPFARTMLNHFTKLQSPLKSAVKYPSSWSQLARFSDGGWQTVSVRSLWHLWMSDEVVSPSEKRHIDSIEPFDEWEEFCMFASHYFVILATSASTDFGTRDLAAGKGNIMIRDRPGVERLRLSNSLDVRMADKQLRRYGASFVAFKDSIVHHGGQGIQGRLSDAVRIVSHANATIMHHPAPEQEAVCHTITSLGPANFLMVGGRSSPDRAHRTCYSGRPGSWHTDRNLPLGRYRHCALALDGGVLVMGGKHDSVTMAQDWLYYDPAAGWSKVVLEGADIPVPRFGASATTFSMEDFPDISGLLLGGMDASGYVLDDMWAIGHIKVNLEHQLTVHCTRIEHCRTTQPIDRFGAKLVKFDTRLLLVGGITGNGVPVNGQEILQLDIERDLSVKASRVDLLLQRDRPRIMLIGHQVEVVDDGSTLLVLGGGAVCFSFGTFWNPGLAAYKVQSNTNDMASRWHFATLNHQPQLAEGAPSGQTRISSKGPGEDRAEEETQNLLIPDLRLAGSPQRFEEVVSRREPVVLKDVNIGRCVELWDDAYLKAAIGGETEVVVHVPSSPSMNFVAKNFEYVKKPFGQFIEDVGQGKEEYLRATATSDPTSKPTKLDEDFPRLAKDFVLPRELGMVSEREHSSPLRISGPVTMWLHYDVMSNVLCQIRGSKKVLLYPPGNVNELGYAAGASSSELNPFKQEDADMMALRRVKTYEALLNPGDVLFIPAFWSHTAAPTEGSSVAVNVFFRDLDQGYAAGKDVYGNRDLQAYENGRRDVQRMIRSFRDLPKSASDFYIRRLAAELYAAAGTTGR